MATVRPGTQNLSGKRDEGSSDINESGEPEEWMEGAGNVENDYVSSYARIATNSYAICIFLHIDVTGSADISEPEGLGNVEALRLPNHQYSACLTVKLAGFCRRTSNADSLTFVHQKPSIQGL